MNEETERVHPQIESMTARVIDASNAGAFEGPVPWNETLQKTLKTEQNVNMLRAFRDGFSFGEDNEAVMSTYEYDPDNRTKLSLALGATFYAAFNPNLPKLEMCEHLRAEPTAMMTTRSVSTSGSVSGCA